MNFQNNLFLHPLAEVFTITNPDGTTKDVVNSWMFAQISTQLIANEPYNRHLHVKCADMAQISGAPRFYIEELIRRTIAFDSAAIRELQALVSDGFEKLAHMQQNMK
ncbi:MAG: hypothetical protein PUP93_30460 [Rhizonema sp. NSF051]|nr:hypothetical protein [Rhizonema sp. NSF051]